MFDAVFYTNTLMNAANTFLANNIHQYGREFANAFMANHDLNNGPQTHQAAQNFFGYAARKMPNGQASDAMIWQIVREYVDEIYRLNTPQQQGFGSGGGFGGYNNGGFSQPRQGFQSGFGNNFGSSPRPSGLSQSRDDSISAPVKPQQPQAQPIPTASPSPQAAPVFTMAPASAHYAHNLMDEMDDQVELTSSAEEPNWGAGEPKDQSIVVMQRQSVKSPDSKYVMQVCEGFDRIYTDNQMDVVDEFFKVAPSSFLAQHFLFRIFYNHVETLDVPTESFLEAQQRFLKALEKESTAYRAIIDVLNGMLHGPRMALAGYLVSHINRALYLNCRMTENIKIKISFTQIEDLDELLGPNFDHSILEVPNAREMLTDIVNNAIRQALSGYSNVMFTDENKHLLPGIMRTSSAFPTIMKGIYPNKSIIPDYGTKAFDAFYTKFVDEVLSQKTFVRSIRSVIITNLLGEKYLPHITQDPIRLYGRVAAMLSQYRVSLTGRIALGRNDCQDFDEVMLTDSVTDEYLKYAEDPNAYMRQDISRYTELHTPRYPVDQTVFAIQFKTAPTKYLKAIDLIKALNEPREKTSCVFVKNSLETIHPV